MYSHAGLAWPGEELLLICLFAQQLCCFAFCGGVSDVGELHAGWTKNVSTFQAGDLPRNKVTSETKLILSHAVQSPFACLLRPPFSLPPPSTVAIVIYSRPPRLLFHRLRRTQPELQDKAYPTRRM